MRTWYLVQLYGPGRPSFVRRIFVCSAVQPYASHQVSRTQLYFLCIHSGYTIHDTRYYRVLP